MKIGGISGGSYPYTPKPAAAGGGNAAQLERQKKALQEEMKRVEEDDKLQPEAKEKKLAMLQRKMQKIENEIQKASVESEESSGTQTSAVEETSEVSATDELNNLLLNQDSITEDMQEQMHTSRFDEAGNLLNRYV